MEMQSLGLKLYNNAVPSTHLAKVESMLNYSENSISSNFLAFSLLFFAITFLKTSIFSLYYSTTLFRLSRSILFLILFALNCSNSSFRLSKMSCWMLRYFSSKESFQIFSLRSPTKCQSWSNICLDTCSSLDSRVIVSFSSLSSELRSSILSRIIDASYLWRQTEERSYLFSFCMISIASHLLHLIDSAFPYCFLLNCLSLNSLSYSFNFSIYSSKRIFSSFNFSFSPQRPNQSLQLLSAVSIAQFFPEKLSIDIPEAVGRQSHVFISSKVLIRLELGRKRLLSQELFGFLGEPLRCRSWVEISRVL